MSQILKKIQQLASRIFNNKAHYKSSESVSSSRPNQGVGDSILMIEGRSMTNANMTTTGTFTGLILLGLVAGLSFNIGLSSIDAHADSITVSISGNPTINVAPTSEGTFADSGNINISVTNAPASGYTLAITGGGDTSLTGKTDSTKSITSISSAIDQNTFNTNTNYNNKWGYKPSMHYNTSTEQRASNSNYLPSPTSNADIIDITSDNSSNNYTMSIGARVTSDLGFQTYENNTFVITAVGNMFACDSSKLCIEYNGNGLTYDEETLNRVNYNSITTQKEITKYSHTSNISDAGVQSGNYARSLETNEVINIPGAQSLHINLTYSTYYVGYDWVSFWAGNYPNYTANSNYETGIQRCGDSTVTNGKFGNSTWSSSTVTKVNAECDVSGDAVTFGFHSDSRTYGNYGYYAIITGTGTVYNRSVSSGEYATPTGTNAIFHGWSTTQTTPGSGLPSQVEYTDESDVMANIPGNEGETKTIYAVWQQGQPITFNMDSNTSNIDIIDSNGTTVKTITATGQTATLVQGDTYTIKPTHTTGYVTDTITKTSGAGTLSGKEFTVGSGATTINVTSKLWDGKMQTFDCRILANVGDTISAIDSRDNESYLIGKLADGKCWMLDNLRLGSTSAIALTTANTNSSGNFTLPAGITSDFKSYTAAQINVAYKNNTTTSYGSGSGKVGVYYNFCAASAGTICTSSNTSNASYDICPAGWRMPTGGSFGEYKALYTAYSSDATNFRNALSTPLSGYFYGSTQFGLDGDGDFWSSTYSQSNDTYMYGIDVNSGYIAPEVGINRNVGYSIRCVAK